MKGDYLWPNELTSFNDKDGTKVLVIPDGFLIPWQNDGGLFCIRNPDHPESKPFRITSVKTGWFYHRATYLKLPGPFGQEGILTARATKPLFGQGRGELVWLTPPAAQSVSPADAQGRPQRRPQTEHRPWTEIVLVEGPDVMFETVDIDPNDDTVEIVSAHFFGQKLSVHSLQATETYPFVRISDTYVLDTVGQPYGLCLAHIPNLKDPKEVGSTEYCDCHNHTTATSDLTSYRYLNNTMSVNTGLPSSTCEDPLPPLVSSKYSIDALSSTEPSSRCQAGLAGPNNSNIRRTSSLTQLYMHTPLQNSTALVLDTSSPHSPQIDSYAYSKVERDLRQASYTDLNLARSQPSSSSLLSSTPLVPLATAAAAAACCSYTHVLVTTHECSYDLWSTVKMAVRALSGQYPRVRTGASVSKEYSAYNNDKIYKDVEDKPASLGGSLFAYELPKRLHKPSYLANNIPPSLPLSPSFLSALPLPPKKRRKKGHNSDPSQRLDWNRYTLCTGFKVKGWGGIFSPGAPGFPYVFSMPHQVAAMVR